MSDVLPPPPGRRTGSGDPPLELHHVGQRYGLGSGAEIFGIWDTQAPGAPAYRFPRTPEGWRDAWETFSRLEPAVASVTPTWGPGWTGSDLAPTPLPTNGPAVASLVLGIIGVVLWFPFVGLAFGVLAMVFAYLGFKRADATGVGRGLAFAGLVLGIVAGVAGVLILFAFNEVADRLDQIQELESL